MISSTEHISKQRGTGTGKDEAWIRVGQGPPTRPVPRGHQVSRKSGRKRGTYDMNTQLSQPFLRSLILCCFLRAPSSTTNAVPIYHGPHDLEMSVHPCDQKRHVGSQTHPDWRRLGPLSIATSVHPLDSLRFLLQALIEQRQMPYIRGVLRRGWRVPHRSRCAHVGIGGEWAERSGLSGGKGAVRGW
jgi:hypothetical protein